MTREEVMSGLIEILKTIRTIDPKKLDELTESDDFISDLGCPSTELINIIAKAEDRFNLEFDDDDVDDLGSSVKDTIDIIIKTHGEQHS